MARKLSDFAHPDYVRFAPDWQKIRDCFDGERAIKEGREKYLPRLSNQAEIDYQNYLRRALFFPITGKTVLSLVGLATSKAPTIEAPTAMEKYFSDTSSSAFQFTEFYVGMLTELLLQGRYGVLLDAPFGRESDPIPVPYIAENIINWDITPTQEYTMLLLREHKIVIDPTDFSSTHVTQYRHCYLSGGVYTQQLLNEDLKPDGSPITPTFSGSTLNYIPFLIVGTSGIHAWCDKPPMLDISTINISHYMTSADLEWGRHIVGLPTPVVTGVDAGSKLTIGGTAAWILPTENARAFYLEFQGQGLGSLEIAMKEKISLMATMSARLMDTSTKGSEAASTVRLRYISETASLVHIIGSAENALQIIFSSLATLRRDGEVKIALSRDILNAAITFVDLKVLYAAFFQGGLSKASLVYNLRRLDAIDPNRTDEEELAAIQDPILTPTSKPADLQVKPAKLN